MGAWHRLAVYYGLREDRRLADQMDRETSVRPWRVAAFALGVLAIVGIPTLILIVVLNRSFALGDVGKTAVGVLAAWAIVIWLISAIAWVKDRVQPPTA